MSNPAKIGILAVAYLNTGSYSTPTWVAVTSISDWKVGAKWDEGEASTRLSRMKLAIKTMVGIEISGKLRAANSGDATYTTIRAALVTDAQLDMMILDGPSGTNGVNGFRADFQVFDGSQDQGLNAVVFDEVTFKPSPNTDGNYNSVLVSGSAPVFTAM
jgi:hypothetical protein